MKKITISLALIAAAKIAQSANAEELGAVQKWGADISTAINPHSKNSAGCTVQMELSDDAYVTGLEISQCSDAGKAEISRKLSRAQPLPMPDDKRAFVHVVRITIR